MNILISVTDLCVGGGQNFALRLAKFLAQQHSVFIFNYETFEKRCQALYLGDLPKNLKIISLPKTIYWFAKAIDACLSIIKIKSITWQAFQKNYLKSIINLYKIDLVNSHLYDSDYFVVETLENLQIPIVITDHGDYRYIVKEELSTINKIEKIVNRANAIVYPSHSNAQAFSKYTSDSKLIEEVIYYGIPPETPKSYPDSARKKLGISEDAFVFGMVARGIPDKGWAEAIAAFKLAKLSSARDIHLILVGGDDYLSSLKESLEPHLASSIHFVGYSSNPDYWIKSFDVGLLPTYFPGESLPNSVIEYLLLGKPVIATTVGGIPEMLTYDQKQAGFTVSLDRDGKADVAMLAEAIANYINDPDLFEAHAKLTKPAFEKFNMQTCVEAYEKLFQQILS
ncbi:MAG: glycosyltransferase family 4 protein [Hydrococcus sp. Prado102]|jgi:glycosyltransferase involved in cell wall biosynthesis|nr:glycosyltransferase family 4 protein [Hydrococcus sp. Prado102]